MEAIKFNRLRQIILDSATFVAYGVCFDTQKVYDKGFSDEEIANAEYLLTESSYFVSDFVHEVKQITSDVEAEFHVFLVEFAKIIFVVYEDSQKSIHFFKEELQKMVLLNQYHGYCCNFLQKKSCS